ncbi:hypothetical protein [Flavobacterium covae]|uniref:hypothetical protein n=1 Tax=Flavobacterium covae TaxID=2906076 RepID=UPI000745C147|nr:hypothetical protein [Flavobacterium covae]AMA48999.1 hypothetical protein AWN65_05730 [Flavobacterium covae]MCJ1809918.1 hypothetical protein [Flavobacterium covae]
MDKAYSIDWRNYIIINLRSSIRKFKYIKLFEAFLRPVVWLHLEFLEFRRQALYKLSHNSQICYLQAVLNDFFDNDQRRIIITNAILREPVWFYEPEEDKPVRHYEEADNKPVYYREENEFVGDGADFIVVIPIDLKPSNNLEETALLIKIRAQIDYYKLYVKNYIIIWD